MGRTIFENPDFVSYVRLLAERIEGLLARPGTDTDGETSRLHLAA